MASVEYQNSILWRGEDPLKAKFKPQNDKTKKVVRYFPGKAPRWAPEDAEKKASAEDADADSSDKEVQDSRSKRHRRRHVAAVVVEKKEDAAASRLKRLRSSATGPADATDRLQRHRRMHEAQVLEAADEKKDSDDEIPVEVKPEVKPEMQDDIIKKEDEDDDDLELAALRREKIRAAALLRRQEEETLLKDEEEDDIEEDEDSSEESDSDDPRRAMMKPVFVSKSMRETVKEKEAQQREEEAVREREKQRAEEKKTETKSMLFDTIRADEEAEAAGLNDCDRSDIELIDDDDEKNEAEEYELWKIRELKRIKRDKEERHAREQEIEFIERRRRMTDAEREEDDRRMDEGAAKREEAKQFGFLQKYFHRGGFFQDKATTGEEPLYNRDYHEPTAEETFDKSILPKAMQVRRGLFGKKGQVKHTHLTDVDTTDMSAAWSQHTKQIQKYQERMATAKGVHTFDRPSGSARSSHG